MDIPFLENINIYSTDIIKQNKKNKIKKEELLKTDYWNNRIISRKKK